MAAEVVPTSLVIFPSCPTYGFSVQPQYLVKTVMRELGYERINRCWARPLITLTATPVGDRDEEDVQLVLYFWHAMGGRRTAFLFKDWTDYKSCQTQNTPAATDQPLVAVTLADASTAYQLVKQYAVGDLVQSRDITKPRGDTIVVANNFGDVQTEFTLDEGSGLLKPRGGFTGTPHTWGGEFYVPVRFNSELDVQVVDSKIQSVSFTLQEKRLAFDKSVVIDIPPPAGAIAGSAAMAFAASATINAISAVNFSAQSVAPANLFGPLYAASSGVIVAYKSAFGGDAYRSTDDGVSWSSPLSTLTGFAKCFGVNKTSGTVICGGASGEVRRSTDHGATFGSNISVGSIGDVVGIACDGAGNWFATGGNFNSSTSWAVSNDDGVTWHVPGGFSLNSWVALSAQWDATNNQFFAQGFQISTSVNAIYTSATGATLTETTVGSPVTQVTGRIGYDVTTGKFIMGIQSSSSPLANVRVAASPAALATASSIVSGVGTTAGDSSNKPVEVYAAGGLLLVFGNSGSLFTSKNNGSTWTAGNTAFPTGGGIDLMRVGSTAYDTATKTLVITGGVHASVSTYIIP